MSYLLPGAILGGSFMTGVLCFVFLFLRKKPVVTICTLQDIPDGALLTITGHTPGPVMLIERDGRTVICLLSAEEYDRLKGIWVPNGVITTTKDTFTLPLMALPGLR